MDASTATTWKQFFGDGAAAPAAAILLIANVAQWLSGRAERARAAKSLEEANRRCIDISASVTSVAQQFVQATQSMKGGARRPHAVEEAKAVDK